MLLGLEGIHDLNSSVGFRGQKEIKCVSKAHFPRHHSPNIKMLRIFFEVFKRFSFGGLRFWGIHASVDAQSCQFFFDNMRFNFAGKIDFFTVHTKVHV